ncbi:GIY-YIG nuclease family protein [Paenibacillus sp. 481]|uniref:GIY-YIG nuclease family protein n=1 Tax=Paenibacillus sp. 481 TaxID=2835869 RepID=UPI001E5F7F0A|nr:GIY-YIG nuclease family protein [Paenibacillus sp. 481]UHA72802.1 GIY-YIG nuclease family protein [Paenibacillus sp. 481]
MDRKKELVQQYKELKTVAGVYQIKNNVNQKIWIDSTRNVKTLEGKRFMLQLGTHMNKALQREWNEFGETAFTFELLEPLKQQENVYVDTKDELKKLEEKWMEQLQPYDERGYHTKR